MCESEIQAETSLAPQPGETVQDEAIKRVAKTREKQRDEHRDEVIVDFYSGLTTGEIARKFSVSRQNIFAMLKHAGVDMNLGGRAVKSVLRKQEIEAERDRLYQEKYQCTYREWETLSKTAGRGADSPVAAFNQGKAYARRSGISWTIGLTEWWSLWEESGKWELRGKHCGDYCMLRIDQGIGYEKGNIRIGSNQEHWASVRAAANQRRVEHPPAARKNKSRKQKKRKVK